MNCTNCGAALDGESAACPTCGTLVSKAVVATPGADVGTRTVQGILVGLVVGVVAALLVFQVYIHANPSFTETGPGCMPLYVVLADSVIVAAFIGIVAAFFGGLRLVKRRRPFLGGMLMSAALVVLLPVSTCGTAALFYAHC